MNGTHYTLIVLARTVLNYKVDHYTSLKDWLKVFKHWFHHYLVTIHVLNMLFNNICKENINSTNWNVLEPHHWPLYISEGLVESFYHHLVWIHVSNAFFNNMYKENINSTSLNGHVLCLFSVSLKVNVTNVASKRLPPFMNCWIMIFQVSSLWKINITNGAFERLHSFMNCCIMSFQYSNHELLPYDFSSLLLEKNRHHKFFI